MTKIDLDKAVVYHDKRAIKATAAELVALVAGYQEARGLEVDGMMGPSTRARLTSDIVTLDRAARPGELTGDAAARPAPEAWPPFDGPIKGDRPNTIAELNAVYGNPCDAHGNLNPAWKKKHLVTCDPGSLPGVYPDGPGRYVTVHRLMLPYLVEGLTRGLIVCPDYRVRLGGHNHRRMRHDTPAKAKARNFKPPLRQLSRHAWGCAVDGNTEDNDPEENWTAAPWSPAWMERWPDGHPRAWVEAMESVGFRWGGRWRGFCDPMHFELAGGPDGVQL